MKQFLLLLALSVSVLSFEQTQHSIFFDTFNFLQAKVNHFTGAVKRLVTEQKTIYVSNSTGTPSFVELPVRTKSYEALIEDLSSFFGKSINKVEKILPFQGSSIVIDQKHIHLIEDRDKLLVTLGNFLEFSEDIFGIDLGTSYTSIARIKQSIEGNFELEIISNEMGNRLTPSVVSFNGAGEPLVGEAVRIQDINNQARTVYSIKRIMGLSENDTKLDDIKKNSLYRIESKDGRPYVYIPLDQGRPPLLVLPEQISALILGKVKESAENYLGKKIKKVVITVPARFTQAQRSATISAAKIAEPTAAAYAYGMTNARQIQKFMVVDFGGGTLDISILQQLENGTFNVLATEGDVILGGDDVTQKVADFCVEQWKDDISKLTEQKRLNVMRRIWKEADEAKKQLTTNSQVTIFVDVTADSSLTTTLSRTHFEVLIKPVLERVNHHIHKMLDENSFKVSDIDTVLLVGGSCKIPAVRRVVSEIFPGKVKIGINPDEAITHGAALYGHSIKDKKVKVDLVDISAFPIGIGISDGCWVKSRNEKALQDLCGTSTMCPFVPRYTKLPFTVEKQLMSTYAGLLDVKLDIYEGDNPCTFNNTLISKFTFQCSQLNPVDKHCYFDMKIHVDENAILTVSARDSRRHSELKVQVHTLAHTITDIEVMQLANTQRDLL